MRRAAMMVAFSLAACVVGSTGLLLPSEKAMMMQDDIVVKPGGGGRAGGKEAGITTTLEWWLQTPLRQMRSGDPNVLRDDLKGKIAANGLDLRLDDGNSHKANWIKFTVDYGSQPVTVTIKRSIRGRFKWSFRPRRNIGRCRAHYDSNDPPCREDGVPAFLMGTLVGNITGEYTTTGADGKRVKTGVNDVKEFRLWGAGS